ncbi:MAG: HAMP domain-containing histidine kinase [Clostridia bacterium]|nr:HAMP domain-containing histidine kinase [Clostridia bacterium]
MKRKTTVEWEKIRRRNTLRWRLTLFVFWVLLCSGFLTLTITMIALTVFGTTPLVLALVVNPIFFMITLLCTCAVIGTLLSGFLGKYYLRPLKLLSNATREVRKGNYKVQVERGEHKAQSEMGELIQSFNEMVQELDGIELFRNDFINNFSHEFKTPIVSIRGFAKEMQREDLSEEERQEYAKIIAEEADRLARLSISVLELSKL